jgi:beta-1,4-mannosyltransferase
MMNHVKSLVDDGWIVDFIGYTGSLPCGLHNNSNVVMHYLQTPYKIKKFYMINGVIRVVKQILHLTWIIVKVPSPRFILMQNPPAIPSLFVVQIMKYFRNSKLVIDWHNFGYSLMKLNLGDCKIVLAAEIYEKTFGKYANLHLCVSQGMAEYLKEWVVGEIVVVYDKAPKEFKRLKDEEKLGFLSKLSIKGSEIVLSEFAEPIKYDRLVVSSTSWTEDEDFSILLKALKKIDDLMKIRESDACLGPTFRILMIITGSGPLKDLYMDQVSKLDLEYVLIKTCWLRIEDYPSLLGSADLGISLHTSSSGLDLPMKIVDMFGCGLPVCAKNYPMYFHN